MIEKAKELYKSGLSQKQVADKLGVTRMKIRWLFKKDNFKSRTKNENSNSKRVPSEIKRTKRTWQKMHSRCSGGPEYNRYKSYKGKGISVCERWKIFENFVEDMGIRPLGLSIDRIENSKGYFKDNCRWATNKEQMNNTDFNSNVTFNGKTQTISQWADEYCLAYSVLSSRLIRGWDVERAFTTRPIKGKLYHYRGKIQTIKKWAEDLDLTEVMIRTRLWRGWPEDEVFSGSKKNEINVTIDGVTKQFGTWARELNIPRSTAHNRLKRGWSPERSLMTPINKKHSPNG